MLLHKVYAVVISLLFITFLLFIVLALKGQTIMGIVQGLTVRVRPSFHFDNYYLITFV